MNAEGCSTSTYRATTTEVKLKKKIQRFTNDSLVFPRAQKKKRTKTFRGYKRKRGVKKRQLTKDHEKGENQ